MLIRDIFWLTKPKVVLLAVFLVILIPSYYNSGFSIFNFYTAFVLSYLTASIMVELYNAFFKKSVKKVD